MSTTLRGDAIKVKTIFRILAEELIALDEVMLDSIQSEGDWIAFPGVNNVCADWDVNTDDFVGIYRMNGVDLIGREDVVSGTRMMVDNTTFQMGREAHGSVAPKIQQAEVCISGAYGVRQSLSSPRPQRGTARPTIPSLVKLSYTARVARILNPLHCFPEWFEVFLVMPTWKSSIALRSSH